MKMKKWVILLVCVALLCGAVATSIAIVSAQEDSEPEASASESDSLQTECVESTDAGDGMPSEVESDVEPLDVPAVVTRSHMVEKVGEDADLVAEALKLYAGQDTKYRVQVDVNWDDRDNRAVHFVFHSLINYDVTKCYECGKNGNFEHTSTDQKKVSEILYRDLTRYLECDTLAIPDLFAELNEESIRILLNCEGVTVTLIDELPEHLLPYNEPFDEPEVPAVVTRSHMVEKVGEDADLVAEALKLYAGQDTEYCIVVTAEEKAGFESFMEFAVELYRTQYHCEVWPGYSDDLIIGGWGDYLEDYQNGLYGTFYFDKDMKGWAWRHTDDAYWLSPLYAELPEAALRAVLECGGVSVQLIDAFPEDVVKIDASVDA